MASIACIEGRFRRTDQTTLYYQVWRSPLPPEAIVIIIHGLGGHSGTFPRAVQWLVSQGYTVYGLDLRGHGRSSGQRGYIQTWAEYRTDLRQFLTLVGQQQPTINKVLWGHSLGSIIVLDYALRFAGDLQGLIVSGVPMGKVGISPVKLALGRLLSWIWPRFSLQTGVEPEVNMRDRLAIATHRQDPLRHSFGTARLTTEFLHTRAWLREHAAELRVPLLMLHGGADHTAPVTASAQFFHTLGGTDRTWHLYPNSYHELHNDLGADQVLTDVTHWLWLHHSQGSTLERV